MKKITLIFSLLFLLSHLVQSQTQLVIELTTDNNPTETTWKVYDLNRSVVKANGELSALTTYRDTMILDDASCYFWTLYDGYSDGLSGGFTPGSFKIFVDGVLRSTLTEPNFGDSISVYNLGKACNANDVEVNIVMQNYISKDALPITAKILNMGVSPISEMEIAYKVNGMASEAKTITGLSIPIGEVGEVSHPTLYNFTTPGEVTVEFEVLKVNGVTLPNSDYTKSTLQTTVVDGYVQYNVIEDFMSYECGPCWDAGVILDGTLQSFNGYQSLIKYAVWDWADTKYNIKFEDFQDYYRVMGIPHIRLNGESINSQYFTPTYYEDYLGLATPVKITAETLMVGDSLKTTVTVLANRDITNELYLRVLPIENVAYDVYLGGDNSTPFHNMVYDIVNHWDYFKITGLKANEPTVIETTNSIVKYPFEEGSFDDMSIVMYVQEVATKKVLQATQYPLNYEAVTPALTVNIPDGAVAVDTTGLQIVINSNRYLLNNLVESIPDIATHIKMRKGSEAGALVPFTAALNADTNTIVIKPVYTLELNTAYFVTIDKLAVIEGTAIPKLVSSFTTFEPVSVNNSLKNNLNIYPNPATSVLYIESAINQSAEIVSVVGESMQHINLIQGSNQVNVNDFATGLYFIVFKGNTNQRIKFIKK